MKEFKLDNEPKINSGFKVPDAYFDDLHAKIIQRIPEEKTPVISIFSKRKNWLYAAAAILVMALSIPVINHFITQTAEIETATLENYLASHAGISDDEIAELLSEDDIQQIEINTSADTKDLEDELTANSNLEEYIN